MNAQSLAKKAYGNSRQTVKSSRAVEYDAIARITHELKNAAKYRQRDYPSFAGAIHKNNVLWSTLAANVASPQNELPASVRAQIFYLAEFSRRHSAQALAGISGVLPLIEINSAILRGLREGKGM